MKLEVESAECCKTIIHFLQMFFLLINVCQKELYGGKNIGKKMENLKKYCSMLLMTWSTESVKRSSFLFVVRQNMLDS